MTVNLVTGSAGTPHIDGDDVGHLLAGVVGADCYVLKTGSQLKATMSSANSLSVAAGDAVMHGRHVRLDSAETVTIESGTQGQRRNDLVCLRYARSTSGRGATVETASVAVLKGTPTTGTAADPTVPSGNVLEGASEDWMPLYRVSLDGITASAPVALFDVLVPAAEVADNVAYVDYDAVSYQKWSDIKVYGHVRSGTLTVTVERNGAEGQARVPKGEWSEIGRLKDSCRPTMWVRQLMGVQGNVWLELLVTPDGVIYLHNIYETEDMYWGSFFGTISCPVKPS